MLETGWQGVSLYREMGTIFFRPKILPEQDPRFFYLLLDDLKNVRIMVDGAGLTTRTRTRIFIEIERAEARIKVALNEGVRKIEPASHK